MGRERFPSPEKLVPPLLSVAQERMVVRAEDRSSVGTKRAGGAMGAGALRERLPEWIGQMRRVAGERPATGACAVATAMEVWSWTFDRFERARAEANGAAGDTWSPPLVEALGWLLSSRALVLDTMTGADAALSDVCHAQVARACGEVGRICAELVFGSLRHPAWDADAHTCYHAEDLETLEEYVPGLTSTARAYSDVIEADGSHRAKAGPCVRGDGVEEFIRLRTKLDGCLAGGYTAKTRAAAALRTGQESGDSSQ
jgi:hypothetical protein